ncbi:alpha/beta fold hydrolase [Nesterenkonia rhizosphaerae]|uniref:Alpha/beta fold hydrolase n=1 Tax=Nesterenkonia rhizosphaerae TaxID=1348272 RepID=A0ABP9FV76_9MICC
MEEHVGTGTVRIDPANSAASPEANLVLVNSLACTSDLWNDVVRHLPETVRVIRFDQRDRGGPAGQRPFSLKSLAHDVFEAADIAGAGDIHVAGVSLGGLVSLQAAIQVPERVRSVTAMCCAARFDEQSWIDRGAQVREHGAAPLVDAVMKRWFTDEFASSHPGTIDFYREMFLSTDDAGYANACDVLAASDLRPSLSAISCPTLLISGEHDPANPVREQELIASAIEGSRHVVVEGAAHLAPASHSAEIAELLVQQCRKETFSR